MDEQSWLAGEGLPRRVTLSPGNPLPPEWREVRLAESVRVEAGKSYVVEWLPYQSVTRIREIDSGGWVPRTSGTVSRVRMHLDISVRLYSDGFLNRTVLGDIEVDPDPVAPDLATAALLRAEFPGLAFTDQGWLLWASPVGDATPPAGFGEPVPSAFTVMGAVDRVSRPDEATIVVAGQQWRSTLPHLDAVVRPAGRRQPRYVTVVADRFNGEGLRCARLVGVRCMAQPFECSPGELWRFSLVATDSVRAWCLPVDAACCQCSCH